jgi:hypothetical protein
MRRSAPGRAALVVGALLVCGIAVKLLSAILSPVLPAGFMTDLRAGWQMFYAQIAPAVPAIIAEAILAAICWVLAAWWGRDRS